MVYLSEGYDEYEEYRVKLVLSEMKNVSIKKFKLLALVNQVASQLNKPGVFLVVHVHLIIIDTSVFYEKIFSMFKVHFG